MIRATHYLVVKSPYAEALCLGYKSAEFRSWADRLSGKTVAIAVAKAPTRDADIAREVEDWGYSGEEEATLRALCAEGLQGKIIGQVAFGEHGECTWPYPGEPMVHVEDSELWEPCMRLDSPGGLGLRPIPR